MFNLQDDLTESIIYPGIWPYVSKNQSKFMTFGAFSLNYTYNISIDPLGWHWILKVGPLNTFLLKKIGIFSEKFTLMRRDSI